MERKQDFLEAYRGHSLFERRELAQPHMSYAFEKEKYRVIRDGRVDLLDSVSRLLPDGTEGVLSKDALRHQKNMLIAAITIFTRSANILIVKPSAARASSPKVSKPGQSFTSSILFHPISVYRSQCFCGIIGYAVTCGL